MKFNVGNCEVSHRQENTPNEMKLCTKMKGFELITAIQEQALMIITNNCRKTSAPGSESKENVRNCLERNKSRKYHWASI